MINLSCKDCNKNSFKSLRYMDIKCSLFISNTLTITNNNNCNNINILCDSADENTFINIENLCITGNAFKINKVGNLTNANFMLGACTGNVFGSTNGNIKHLNITAHNFQTNTINNVVNMNVICSNFNNLIFNNLTNLVLQANTFINITMYSIKNLNISADYLSNFILSYIRNLTLNAISFGGSTNGISSKQMMYINNALLNADSMEYITFTDCISVSINCHITLSNNYFGSLDDNDLYYYCKNININANTMKSNYFTSCNNVNITAEYMTSHHFESVINLKINCDTLSNIECNNILNFDITANKINSFYISTVSILKMQFYSFSNPYLFDHIKTCIIVGCYITSLTFNTIYHLTITCDEINNISGKSINGLSIHCWKMSNCSFNSISYANISVKNSFAKCTFSTAMVLSIMCKSMESVLLRARNLLYTRIGDKYCSFTSGNVTLVNLSTY